MSSLLYNLIMIIKYYIWYLIYRIKNLIIINEIIIKPHMNLKKLFNMKINK